ncbi:MAG: hypothetical protein A2W63_01195 [Deltaproteobacteria bacterium RIFCSPLOWO2_02_44_9]|nr:MAG: hypothetical protein A2W63_01195 [Deltaproteobacteria bacterium RIFCSPLOWO2_02_44_9]
MKMQISNFKFQISNLKSFYCLVLTAYCLLSFTGCTSSNQQVKREGAVNIEKVSVVGDGNEVLIKASGPLTYTAFKLPDPDRLVLDIPDADIEKVSGPLEPNNDFISTITVTSYKEQTVLPIARVEIGLKEGVNSEVKLVENSIVVSLNHEATQQEPPPQAAEPPAEEPQQEAAEKEAPAAAKQEKKADKLLRIETKKEGGAIIIKIVGNGVIGDFNAFDIDKPAPPRLVVDVWGVKNSITKRSLRVNSPMIKRVRVGEHPDKVRLVFDSNQKKLPSYTIERIEDTLVVTAWAIDAKKQEKAKEAVAVTAQDTPAVADVQPIPPAEPQTGDYAEIKAVDFKQLTDKASLTIVASKKVEYKLSKTSNELNLVLDIRNAVIADEMGRTLDASELNTPVSSISSFQASAEPAKEVRIIVKLKERSSYDISQDGEKIEVNFPLLAARQTAPKNAEEKSQESGVGSQELKETKPTEEAINKEQASGYTGRKISLDFKDADINNILRLMAEISNLNIIAGDDVKGKMSLRLVDVPWDQAFDIILKTNGLGRVQEGNVVRIMPVSKIKQENEELLASRKAKEKLEDLEIKLLPVNYATASSLESQVKGLLSDRGSVTVEARTNTLIIKDIPANIKKAVDLITQLDTQTPQVLIEARIVEAQSNFARDLGVQWGAATSTTSKDKFNTAFGSTSTTATSPPVTLLSSGGAFATQQNYAVSLPASGSAGPLGAMGFSFGKLVGDAFLLDLRISAGEKNGLTKTISRPRITTLDNKEAKISQGDSVPFETTSSSGTQTSFIDATLELTVTPHITPDGSVSMKIKASRNSIGSFRSAAGTPSISKKEASTEIIVKSGETAVIGGIVVSDESNASSGIPWLKEIPILGWLFKNKSTADSQTELLIFITPNIVKGQIEPSS